jgi:hypothetical protein
MSLLATSLLVGVCCALCAAIPAWLWGRAIDEQDRLREELTQARMTIQSLHRQMGLTRTQHMPLSERRRLWRDPEH